MLDLIVGRDGEVRAAKLRAGRGVLERAIQHLYPLQLACDDPETTNIPQQLSTIICEISVICRNIISQQRAFMTLLGVSQGLNVLLYSLDTFQIALCQVLIRKVIFKIFKGQILISLLLYNCPYFRLDN